MKRITKRDKDFCYALIADRKLNPASAAIKVGYSDSVAKTKAYLWISESDNNPKPQVKAFYDKLMNERFRNNTISADKIDNELAKIAFSNIVDIIEKMGGHINLKLLKNLTEAEKHSISQISETEHNGVINRTIKLHSKIDALKLLIKRLGKNKTTQNILVKILIDKKVVSEKKVKHES